MELHQLQKQIVTKSLDRMYIFTGDEVAVMDIYIQQMQNVLSCTSSRVDTVQEAYQRMTKKTMSKQPRLFIVRDDKEFLKQDKHWESIEKDFESGEDIIIVMYTSLDKRSKFYKKYKDRAVVFDKLSPEILSKYIDKELPGMSEKERLRLADVCECDYSRILLECDKIKHFSRASNKEVDVISVDYGLVMNILIEQGVIYQPIGDITFKLTDAIVLRDYNETAKYLQQAKAKHEPEIMVLSILYNNFKQILLVQGLGRDRANAAARTGLTGWQVNMALHKLGHYRILELMSALKLIRFIEKGIKTGQIEAGMALEYLIVNIL